MKLHSLLKMVAQGISRNSPSILTGIGVMGVVTTTVLAVKATPKALAALEEAKEQRPPEAGELTKKEVVQVTWRLYIPASLSAMATIASIVGGHVTLSKRNVAIIGAYAITENALTEYKNAVKESLGEKDYEKVQDQIAQKRMQEDPPSKEVMVDTEDNQVLCYDTITGRYFKSDVETIRRAENTINEIIIKDMYASVNDFFDLIGLRRTEMGEVMGWSIDNLVDLSFSSTLTPDNTPCLTILYDSYPLLDYYKIN